MRSGPEAVAGDAAAAGREHWCPPLIAVGSAAVLFVWVTLDILLDGPWLRLDIAIADAVDVLDLRHRTVPNFLLWLLTQTGGRGTILVVIGALTLTVVRARRVWQPLLRVGVTLVLLTVVVYALKVGLGRTAPGVGESLLHAGGLSYPSGHSANAVLWWGTAVWMVRHYRMPLWLVRLVTGMAVAAPVLTTVAMLALNYHWLTDVVAGLALGLILLWVVHLIFRTRLGQWGDAVGGGGTRAGLRERPLVPGSGRR